MPATFESLAAELREKIYEYVWAGSSVILKDKSILHIPPETSWGPEPRISSVYPPKETPNGEGDDASSSSDGSEGEGEEMSDHQDGTDEGAAGSDEVEDGPDDEEATINFDVRAFLDEERDDDDFELDSENSDGDEQENYTIACTSPVDIALLYVNHKINSEALPIFYRSHNFIFDTDGVSVMRFLMALPPRAQANVSHISLPYCTMMGDDRGSRAAWSGTTDVPKFRDPEMTTMVTPFGAFLAQSIQDKTFGRLKEVSFFFPFGNESDWYCTWAPRDLGRLLLDEVIERLNYVFCDEIVAKVLDRDNSVSCYESMLGRHAYQGAILEEEFEELVPMPDGPGYYTEDSPVIAWMDEQDQYVERNGKLESCIAWAWGDRDIKWTAEDGPVQAVISMWVKENCGCDVGEAQGAGEN